MIPSFVYVPEREDPFLSLFPHRYDYIYASHPNLGDRPQWQTESRYPLSDRLIQQGASLYGVRFGPRTQYCLLDIDATSPYHPANDGLAIPRIVEALEPLGLVNYVACTSSYSQGLHLYFPFEPAQNSWQLSVAITVLLQSQGFKCQPGELEVFPNSKLYVVDDTPNLFNAHRLPLQTGSYLLNKQLEPVSSSQAAFLRQWTQCQERNAIDELVIEQVLKQSRRRRYRVSQKAEAFLNDLNAEIEPGWTGQGQTNYLLGRITMRTYIFHHVMKGGTPLSGEALVDTIVTIATALPGYCEWCSHQHEIHQRAEEWARCIENSHYFPYGAQHGKYKAKGKPTTDSTAVEQTWNEQRSQTAQDRIRAAMAELLQAEQLPEATTARFKQLVSYGISGSTLYKYKSLWHPDRWSPPQTPQSTNGVEASALATPATAPHPTSLLPADACNPLSAQDLSDSEAPTGAGEVCNEDSRRVWRQRMLALKAQRSRQQQAARSQREAYWQVKARQTRHRQAETMAEYMRSRDPILMKAALEWVVQQDTGPLPSVIPIDIRDWLCTNPDLEALMAVCEQILRLAWPLGEAHTRLGNGSDSLRVEFHQ